MTADQIIAALDLKPLPFEGGFFRETYRSADVLAASSLPARYPADKSAATAIYYLLTPDTVSALHRLPTDEVFHFYAGDPVTQLQLFADGRSEVIVLGPNVLAGQRPQVVVARGVWQGSFVERGFSLMGTTMSPGFDPGDFEAGDRRQLTKRFPQHTDLIRRLTP
jgi:predicted cupin superfamily sugar epimerase